MPRIGKYVPKYELTMQSINAPIFNKASGRSDHTLSPPREPLALPNLNDGHGIKLCRHIHKASIPTIQPESLVGSQRETMTS